MVPLPIGKELIRLSRFNYRAEVAFHSHPSHPKGLRPKSNRASLKLADHLFTTALPAYPLVDDQLSILQGMTTGMDGNGPDPRFGKDFTGAGDCVSAMADHGLSTLAQILTGANVPWTTSLLQKCYDSQNPGFTWDNNPKTGCGSPKDGGMDIQLSLEWLVQQGYILGFAEVDITNLAEVNAAIYWFLVMWSGVTLDNEQMDQFNANEDWDWVKTGTEDGGHGVPFVWYDVTTGKYKLWTWAKLQEATQAFATHQLNQGFVVLTEDLVHSQAFRSGFNLASYASAWEAITGKTFPVTVPTPTPVPVNPPVPVPVNVGSLVGTVSDLGLMTHLKVNLKLETDAEFSAWLTNHLHSYFKET